MGKIRISVSEIDAETGDEVVVIDLTADRELLAQFGPAAVASALGTPPPPPPDNPLKGWGEEVARQNAENATTDAAEAPKRRRRTKAEMEAARAQEQASAQPTVDQVAAALASGGAVTRVGDGTIKIEPASAPEPSGTAYNPFG